MKISFVLILISLSVVHCGYHTQESEVTVPTAKVISGEETDPRLLLINAVENGDVAAVEKLLEEGGDASAKNSEGMTLLMMAVRAQRFAVTETLVNYGADPENAEVVNSAETKTAYDYISGIESTQNIFYALLRGEEVQPEDTNLPLFEQIDQKKHDEVVWLFQKGANPNFVKDDKFTPLIFLLSRPGIKGKEFAKLYKVFNVIMAQERLNPHIAVKGDLALTRARTRAGTNSQYDVMVVALQSWVPPVFTDDPSELLIAAVAAGDVEKTRQWLTEGGDVNGQDGQGFYLLMTAVKAENFAIVDLLIANGADPERSAPVGEGGADLDSFGLAEDSREKTTDLLNAMMAKEDLTSEVLSAPVFDYLRPVTIGKARWLLETGADVNFLNSRGLTPIAHLLSVRRLKDDGRRLYLEALDLLLAQPEIDLQMMVKGKTALERAQEKMEEDPWFEVVVQKIEAQL